MAEVDETTANRVYGGIVEAAMKGLTYTAPNQNQKGCDPQSRHEKEKNDRAAASEHRLRATEEKRREEETAKRVMAMPEIVEAAKDGKKGYVLRHRHAVLLQNQTHHNQTGFSPP